MAAAAPVQPPSVRRPGRQNQGGRIYPFKLPDHLKEWLQEQAREQGSSIAEVLRQLVSRARRADLRARTDDEPELTLAGR